MTSSTTSPWRQIGRIHAHFAKFKSFSPEGRRMAARAEMLRLGLIDEARHSHFVADIFRFNPTLLDIAEPAYRAPLAPELLGLLKRPTLIRGE